MLGKWNLSGKVVLSMSSAFLKIFLWDFSLGNIIFDADLHDLVNNEKCLMLDSAVCKSC